MDEIKSKEAGKCSCKGDASLIFIQEKIEHDHKKLRQSYGFKAKLNEDMNSGQQLRSNEMRKTSFTQPQSPKTGRKATSSTCYGKNSRNSSKPPSVKILLNVTEALARAGLESSNLIVGIDFTKSNDGTVIDAIFSASQRR
ncbi:TPX2 (targeting protein for Xklp2) family protein [Senna tora]|uniref:TPX2 (Targeting protein for Xklp2) family protein n=1 Tax=Senna tora TaxID=362788 RepID=A0A834TML8_9FABA|nr:TPX2 (targeting protein for Xklp2) family protein [Senna tora]